MILETILTLVMTLLQFVFGWINIPSFPEELTNSINSFLDLVFNNLSLLGFFVRPQTITLVIPTLIILLNFEDVYKLTIWIIRKIPFLNIN